MSKRTITWLFGASIMAVLAGFVLWIIAAVTAFASGVFVMDGPDVVDINWIPATWTMIGFGSIGLVAVVGGAIAGLVSWIGALVNTVQLEDKMWFVLLLVLGLFSFGFVAMIVYILAGPDSTRSQPGPGQGQTIGGVPA
jgi:hypothetical protein